MKRIAEDGNGWGAPPQAKRATPPPPKTKFAFKILCPDKLVVALLGSRGTKKDWLQQETGTKLVFSNKGDYYPDTKFRTLGIYSDLPPNIPKALERILSTVIECGNTERKLPKGQTPDFTTDVAGEYLFRLCLSDTASRAVIGPAGTNIQKLRNSTGAKLFVDNQSQHGHQLARILGRPESILDCLRKLHAIVQQGAGTEDFNEWAQTVNFSETVPRQVPPPVRGAVGGGEQDGPVAAPHGPPAVADASLIDERTEQLADAVTRLPPGATALQYSITCALPLGHIDAIAEYLPEVEKASGAGVEIDPPPEDPQEAAAASTRLLSVVGPLLSVYAAHILIIKRSKELEQQALRESRGRRQQEHWPAENAEADPEDRGSEQERRQDEAWEGEELPDGMREDLPAGSSAAEERSERWREEEESWQEGEENEEQNGPPVPKKEELQAKIDALQAQLAQVQARMASSARGGGGGQGRAWVDSRGPRQPQRSWR